MKGLVNKNW